MILKIRKVWERYLSLPSPVKASLWFIFASIIQKGISFITTPIFTRIMTTSEYGTFSVYQSWYALILIFTSLNFSGGVLNNGLTKYPEDRDSFVSSLLGLTTLITSVFFVIYIVFRNQLNNILGLTTIYVLFMFMQLLFEPAYLLWSAKLRFEYEYKPLIVITVLIAFFTPFTGVICVLSSRDKALARVVSFVLVQICIYFVLYCLIYKKGKRLFDKSYWKYALAFNLPLIPHYLSMTILNQSDRLMIQDLCGKEYVAIYSVAYSVSMIMTIISSAINSSFIPFIYQKIRLNDTRRIRDVSFVLLCIMAVVSIIPILLGPELIAILASSEYSAAVWIIPPVSSAVFFIFLYNLFGTIEFYYEKNKFIMVASVFGALLNIGLNYIFIPIYGFVAAGYTTLFCYIVFSVMHGIFAITILRENKVKILPFRIKAIVILSLVIIAIMIGITILYAYSTIIRYIMCGAVLAFMTLNIKRIIGLVKGLKS